MSNGIYLIKKLARCGKFVKYCRHTIYYVMILGGFHKVRKSHYYVLLEIRLHRSPMNNDQFVDYVFP